MTAKHRADPRRGDRHNEPALMGLRFGKDRQRLEAVAKALGLKNKKGGPDVRRVVLLAVSDYLGRKDIVDLYERRTTEDGSSPLKGELK